MMVWVVQKSVSDPVHVHYRAAAPPRESMAQNTVRNVCLGSNWEGAKPSTGRSLLVIVWTDIVELTEKERGIDRRVIRKRMLGKWKFLAGRKPSYKGLGLGFFWKFLSDPEKGWGLIGFKAKLSEISSNTHQLHYTTKHHFIVDTVFRQKRKFKPEKQLCQQYRHIATLFEKIVLLLHPPVDVPHSLVVT